MDLSLIKDLFVTSPCKAARAGEKFIRQQFLTCWWSWWAMKKRGTLEETTAFCHVPGCLSLTPLTQIIMLTDDHIGNPKENLLEVSAEQASSSAKSQPRNYDSIVGWWASITSCKGGGGGIMLSKCNKNSRWDRGIFMQIHESGCHWAAAAAASLSIMTFLLRTTKDQIVTYKCYYFLCRYFYEAGCFLM